MFEPILAISSRIPEHCDFFFSYLRPFKFFIKITLVHLNAALGRDLVLHECIELESALLPHSGTRNYWRSAKVASNLLTG